MTPSTDVLDAPTRTAGPRPVSAPRGLQLSCRGWQQEAALRMLMNNLDPDVAERPDDLVVYGGTGRAARSWEAFDAIVATLRRLGDDETLLVQSGKPVGVFRTHPGAPRVLIANSNLVPRWATWDEFRRLEALGLTMYGQMTAGSWIYIGSQGIVQGTYETFGALAARHFGGSLAGRLVITGGLGGMGGAQPLAATMLGAAVLAIEVDEARIEKRLATRYCDRLTHDLDEALTWVREAQSAGTPLSVGLVGNTAVVLPELVRRGVTPDVLTDQTSAHDMLNGYVPAGMSLADAAALRREDPQGVRGAGDGVGGGARPRDARATTARRRHLRLWKQFAHSGPRCRRGERVRHPGLRPGVHPAPVLSGQGSVSVGRVVRGPAGHLPHGRAGGSSSFPTMHT